MAYDSARGVTVLFGGDDEPGISRETWEWTGNLWLLKSSTGPTARYSHAMCYDASRGVTVLFGGWDGALDGETWEWDGSTWTQRVVSGPSARQAHSMVYDADRGVCVLFGGWGSGDYLGDTWEWNGATWIERGDTGPSARALAAAAYDESRGTVVLFGGNYGGLSDETWELVNNQPGILQHPEGQDADLGQSVVLSVSAYGVGVPLYQWRRDGVELTDSELVSGATSTTLTIDAVKLTDAGDYDVVVTDVCGSVASGIATLEVNVALGDVDCDGTVNLFDVDPFTVAMIEPGDYATIYPDCDIMLADCNQDGTVDLFDIDPFVALLVAK